MVCAMDTLPTNPRPGVAHWPLHDENITAERPSFVTHLECSMTGETYPADVLHGLSRAGRPLLVRYDPPGVRAAFTKDALARRPADMWRLLRISEELGVEILVKEEGRLPTGSFKARGLVMAISMARALGVKAIAMPTNGNAGAAAAAYASRAGMEAVIFCPEDTPEINVREIAAQGGRVYRVNGLIDECGKLVGQGAKERGWFDFSTLKEPYRVEGKKTMGLELAEQLGWELPDVIFYPTGGGTGLIGMWKAFAELEAIGFIGSKRPRMVAVQAEGCAPMVRAWEAGARHATRRENAQTVAWGIRVPQGVGDFLILDAVRESGGAAIAVSDDELMQAVADVGAREGLLLCPEGGATLAALRKARGSGLLKPGERAVLFNCATGLKYPLPDRSSFLDKAGPIAWDTI